MKQKILSLLVLLMTAATGAWAQDPDYDINVHFDNLYNPMQTHFDCDIMSPTVEPGAIKGTLELFVDGDPKGSFDVDGGMVHYFITPGLDAGNHTWSAVFNPEGGSSVNKNGNFTINKANTYIIYYGSTSINLGVGESTELEVYFSENEAGELSYSSSDASVASITKMGYNTYIIQANAAGTATITFSFAGNTNYNAADDKTITVTVVWPAIDVTANEGASGEYWATYYNANATQGYTADENTTVFQAALTGSQLTMTEVAGREIPAGKAVILKSTAASITLTPATTTETLEGNALQGTATAIQNPGNAYVLSKKNDVVGFYKLSSTGTIGANKAYLIYSGSSAPSFLNFVEGSATGIEMPKAETTNNDAEVYDLQGRRVVNPTKGLYIVNGKKVVIK